MNKELAQRIRSAGYWEAVIRPATHVPTRVPIAKLESIVERNAVQIRGWDFPHVDRRKPPARLQDSIVNATEWEHIAELWRFYQSGQFVSLRAMWTDWRDRSGFWPVGPNEQWRRGGQLLMLDAFYSLVEIYEFAARLSATDAGDSTMVIDVTVGGLQGRDLKMESPTRAGLSWSTPAQLSVLRLPTHSIGRDELIADPVKLAVIGASELFSRFGRDDLDPKIIRDWLDDLRRGR